jgi:hypothetical protein
MYKLEKEKRAPLFFLLPKYKMAALIRTLCVQIKA